MYTKLMMSSAIALALLSGCTDKEKKQSLTEGGMKCGAGKCGASMVDGSAVLIKKKMNILDQLEKNDTRRDCVLKASSSKILYDCVRVSSTGRLSTKCSADTLKKAPVKETNTMKCEAGKCSTGK